MIGAVNTAAMAEKILQRLTSAGLAITEVEASEIRRVCAAMHGYAEDDLAWGLVIAAVMGASATGAMIGRERTALVGAMKKEHAEAKAVLVEQVATLRAEVARLMKVLSATHERVATAGKHVEDMSQQLARSQVMIVKEAVAATRQAAHEAVDSASEKLTARIERAAQQADKLTANLDSVELAPLITWPMFLTFVSISVMSGAAALFFLAT